MNIFSQLPEDIIREHIMPYSYSIQPKTLLGDIISYKKVSDVVTELYDSEELDHYISDFMNEGISPISYNYTPNHYTIWRRLYILSDKSDNVIYHSTLYWFNVKMKLCVLTPLERTEFLIFLSRRYPSLIGDLVTH